MSDQVRFERRGAVAWVTLNRPDRKNAISPEMREELIARVGEAGDDADIRCLVLTGAGDAFCAGADIAGAGGRDVDPTPGSIRDLIRDGVQRLFRAVWEAEIPTIAAVNGVAAGFGVHLAVACDLIVCADSARFIESFTRRGIVPDGGGAYLLPRLVGLARAKELVFLADALAAVDAERIGLVNRVVPAEDLESVVAALAERLAAGPTRALALAKRLLNRSLEWDLETALAEEAAAQEAAVATEDMREGMRAFADRRDPRFTGR